MQLCEISWRNIGPYGNKLQTIQLPNNGALWVITGKNGVGKSFFVNLPKILYYGKLDRFKKEEISNRLNKHGWISGIVKTNPGNYVRIERGFSPASIIVEKANLVDDDYSDAYFEDIGKAGITDYQSYIDNEVTKLPYHIFSNIVSLSVNDFKSFISMTPGDKRIIIDKLFSMEVINKMNYLVKYDLRDHKLNTEMYTREILSLKKNIESSVSELAKLNEKLKTNTKNQIDTLNEKLKELEPKLEEAYTKRKQYEITYKELLNTQKAYIQKKSAYDNELTNLNKKISLYNQEKCPTCETPFSDSKFVLLKGDLFNKFNELKLKEESFKAYENKLKINLESTLKAISTIDKFIVEVKTVMNSVSQELKRLNVNKTEEFKSIQNIISTNTKNLQKKSKDKETLDKNSKYLSVLEQLYSDAGVKKKILETYIPTLNSEIEHTLNELHFPYSLSFNFDFEPEMKHLGINIGVDTLSTGEKKRVDLAVLISIIRMLKKKYSGINIFMLDEVLSSIDGDGMYDMIGLLQKTSKELKINIFIINHSTLPIEYFDYKIEIVKNAGFSDLILENLSNNLDI